jgi:hypothetical protein
MTINRTRETGDIVSADFSATHSGPGVTPGDEIHTRPFTTSGTQFSRIADEIGKPIRKPSGYCIPKPVKHHRVKVRYLNPLLEWRRLWTQLHPEWGFQTWNAVSSEVPLDWNYLTSPARLQHFLSDLPAHALRTHSLEAIKRFETQFPQEISIPNFLYELREISTLGSLIRDHSGPWWQRVKNAPGDLLNWEFGWKPFAADLIKLGKLTKTIEARLEHLKSTFGKVTRLGYEVDDWYDFPELLPTPYPQPAWRGLQTELRVSSVKTKLRIQALHRHRIPYLGDITGRLRAFYGALGLGNPLLVMWEAIPYSFVVDYFIDVGGALEALGNLQDETVPWDIWDVSWSSKTTVVFDVFQVNAPPGDPYWGDWKIGEVEVVNYSRTPGYPELSWLTANLIPSPQQATLIAALLLAE